jgi:hypothetical protein
MGATQSRTASKDKELFSALRFGDKMDVETLISDGADVNAKNEVLTSLMPPCFVD